MNFYLFNSLPAIIRPIDRPVARFLINKYYICLLSHFSPATVVVIVIKLSVEVEVVVVTSSLLMLISDSAQLSRSLAPSSLIL